ncbi:hypothetical protein PIB30_023753 [Stylosanthes scabra]|uniref:Uncharacterized protein n=1 Tax=Stylosanthes scabra TaxID=79078 RepID=A0ABU6W7U2_9FABA|nr:hypothetical protein [Stylosanthes scabra]
MDTLSSTVSTLNIASSPTQTHHHHRELFYHHFIRTTPNRQPYVSITPKTSTNKTSSSSSTFLSLSASPSSSPLQPCSSSSSSPIFHSKAATGYAAATIEVAQRTKSLHAVHRDVQRLLRFLQSSNNNNNKGEEAAVTMIMKKVAEEQGKFQIQRHVVALLRMLMKKGKVGIVGEVLEEFERIYVELCGTQVVLQGVQG